MNQIVDTCCAGGRTSTGRTKRRTSSARSSRICSSWEVAIRITVIALGGGWDRIGHARKAASDGLCTVEAAAGAS